MKLLEFELAGSVLENCRMEKDWIFVDFFAKGLMDLEKLYLERLTSQLF